MITVKTYYAYDKKRFNHEYYCITKVCLFGFLPIFIKKVEVSK